MSLIPMFEKQLSRAGFLSIIEKAFFFTFGRISALKQILKKIANKRFLTKNTV